MHALASVWSGLIPETCGLGFSSAAGAGAGVEAAGAEAIGAGVETVAGAGVAAGVGAVASCAFCCCCPGTPILLIRSLPGSSHPAAMAGVRHKMTANKINFSFMFAPFRQSIIVVLCIHVFPQPIHFVNIKKANNHGWRIIRRLSSECSGDIILNS